MSKHVPLFEEHQNATAWYVGLADCHGIEGFEKEPDMSEADDYEKLADVGFDDFLELAGKIRKGWSQQVSMMKLRASANAQRYAVVYRAKLRLSDASHIEDLLNDGEYEDALRHLKDTAVEVQLAKIGGLNLEKAWRVIPNPDLDPFR